ncbi:DUF7619 domain-containing protein [Chryseobacterium gossypii]|uniref:DUF7619 domain-containing protein n=1 Tax=Chryseobacterium gossypii TaxID=3231602 RepID=UPI0035254BAC
MKRTYLIICMILFSVFRAQIVNIPDPYFKAKLVSSNTSSHTIAKNLLGVTVSIDANNDGEIQLSEAQNIGELTFAGSLTFNMSSITSLEGIKSFTNLKKITASNFAALQSIDLSDMTSLENITVQSNNNLTALDIHGSGAILVKISSNPNLTNLFLQNCTALTNLDCSTNNLQSLNVSGLTALNKITANNNHLTSINLSGLPALYEVNFMFNDLTSLILQNNTALYIINVNFNHIPTMAVTETPNLQFLGIAGNNFTSLDFSHFPLLQGIVAHSNDFSVIDVRQNPNLVSLACSGNPNLHTLYLKNGKNNYETPDSTFFYNCPNLTYICADDFEIPGVMAFVTSQGYTCTVNSYCSFTPGGVNYTIQGDTKYDSNNNGCDVNDLNKAFQKFDITDGTLSGTIVADNSGIHSISVGAGSHTITPVLENPAYFNVSPANFTASFPTQTSPLTQNFCLTANGTHNDLEIIIIPINAARPGFDAKYKILYKNKGTTAQSGTISFNYNDDVMNYVSSSLSPNSQSTGILNWNFSNLLPFEVREINLTFGLNTPVQTPPLNSGDVLHHTVQINSTATDDTPSDNTLVLSQTVVNSFDPNDKTCLEGSTIAQTQVGDYVHYMIRFENTGTANAQNIVVKDIIDTSKFDLSTLVPLSGSHNFIARITNPNTVEFIFENIQLPFDDAHNDGYVTFKIKTISTLNPGDSFSNTANIYFDYNAPIVTNTYTTTVQNTLATSEIRDPKTDFSIYPNPVKDILYIKSEKEITKAEIYDISGRIINTTGVKGNSVNVSELQKGLYIIKLRTPGKVMTQKFIKD